MFPQQVRRSSHCSRRRRNSACSHVAPSRACTRPRLHSIFHGRRRCSSSSRRSHRHCRDSLAGCSLQPPPSGSLCYRAVRRVLCLQLRGVRRPSARPRHGRATQHRSALPLLRRGHGLPLPVRRRPHPSPIGSSSVAGRQRPVRCPVLGLRLRRPSGGASRLQTHRRSFWPNLSGCRTRSRSSLRSRSPGFLRLFGRAMCRPLGLRSVEGHL